MKIVINARDDFGRVVFNNRTFNVYTISIVYHDFIWGGDAEEVVVLNRENALRLQEDLRLWLKEHPE